MFLIAGGVTIQFTTSTINDTKICVPLVTLSAQGNAKLLEQIKSYFKRIVNWNKFHSKITTNVPSQYLDFLIAPNFKGVRRLFVSYK